jgi:hypothetical protein
VVGGDIPEYHGQCFGDETVVEKRTQRKNDPAIFQNVGTEENPKTPSDHRVLICFFLFGKTVPIANRKEFSWKAPFYFFCLPFCNIIGVTVTAKEGKAIGDKA